MNFEVVMQWVMWGAFALAVVLAFVCLWRMRD